MGPFDTYHAFFITSILLFGCLTPLSIKDNVVPTVFRSEQVIFSSSNNITKLLVPSDGSTYFLDDVSDLPSVFFTINDSRLDGGSCIYVLEDLAAYEILEGGRDSTSDYSEDKSVYFGSKDGVYKYDSESLSAKKFGPFHDDIIQIQKANGSDVIYFLTSNNKLFKLEQNGTIRTKIEAVTCALEFVLDTSNNIYFTACVDGLPRIIKNDGTLVSYTASIIEDIREVHLLRPAFIMVECIPFFGDGNLYVLYANGTSERKDFYLNRRITAYSIDSALYLVAALDGKIYEYNVMEAMLKSMFGFASNWSTDFTKIVMSIIETTKDSIYKDWNSVFDH